MTGIQLLLVGGYSPPTGEASGISLLAHDRDRAMLTDLGTLVLAESPSYLTRHGTSVYAVNEVEQGRVGAFGWRDGRLLRRSVQATGGAHPCQLAVHPSGRLLAVANYTGGSVALHPLTADGDVGPLSRLIELHGSGPVADRQDAAHAHQVVFDGDAMFVVDLGSDRVWPFTLDLVAGTAASGEPWRLPAGFGPRQLLLRTGFGYVLGELSNQLAVFALDQPGRPVTVVPAAAGPLLPDNLAGTLIGGGSPAIGYVSHRGSGLVSEVRLAGAAASAVTDRPSGGSWPRHLAYHEGYLYVANQLANSVSCLSTSSAERLTVSMASPSCLLPISTGSCARRRPQGAARQNSADSAVPSATSNRKPRGTPMVPDVPRGCSGLPTRAGS
jgi:6-phosphogluconolactonase